MQLRQFTRGQSIHNRVCINTCCKKCIDVCAELNMFKSAPECIETALKRYYQKPRDTNEVA